MKKFKLKIYVMLTIIMCSIMPTMAQIDYGTDVIVKNTSTENQRKPSLTIADNGWLYASYLINNGYVVCKSTNNGQTWANFTNFSMPTRTYDLTKVIVCGTAPYKVFIACLYHTSATDYSLYIDVYDGTTATYINEPLNLSFNTDIYDFEIASDYLFPGVGATPYSVGLLYAVHSSTDSVTFVLSTNGGASFGSKKSVATTIQWFGKVSLAYGRSWNYSNGRYFAVWENKTAFNAPLGHICYARTTSYVYSPFTTPVILDNSTNGFSNKCRNPKIACQYNNIDNDSSNLTALVTFERFWDNLDNDIVGLYNKRAGSGTTWNMLLVDNYSSNNTKQPDVCYDSYFNNFLVTYWDSTHTYLPYTVKSFNIPNPTIWTPHLSVHYNDNVTMGSLFQPYPIVKINDVSHQAAFLWSSEGTGSNGVVMFDAEYSTVSINELITFNNSKINNIYPNPAFGVTNIEIELTKPALIEINAYDITGKKIKNLCNSQLPEGINKIAFDVSSLVNGKYVVEILTSDSRMTKEMIVAH